MKFAKLLPVTIRGSIAVGIVLLLSLAASCVSEGQVSNHSFLVTTNSGGNTPTPAKLCRDLNAFALGRGFAKEPDIAPNLPTSSKVKSFRYGLMVDRTDGQLIVSGSYTENARGVVIVVYGPHQANYQKAADQFFEDFKQFFTVKYGLGTISDHFGEQQ